MQRIDHATAVGTQPAPAAPGTPGYFTEGSAGVTPATVVTDDFLNNVQEELMSVIVAASLTPSKSNNTQLLEAIRSIVTTTVGFPGQIGGLGLTNNVGDPNNRIDFAAGVAMSSDATALLRAAAMTKRLDASWVAGTANGGRGSGVTLSPSTWYHCFVVNKSDGGVDFGFDTNVAGTGLLTSTGGSKAVCIGAVITNAASQILGFKQRNHYFAFDAPTQDVFLNGTLGDARQLIAVKAPLGYKTLVHVRAAASNAASGFSAVLQSPDEADPGSPGTTVPLANLHGTNVTVLGFNELRMFTDIGGGGSTSGRIAARSNAASTVLRVMTLGFEHPRGRW